MTSYVPEPSDDRPMDELSPELRKAVERIAGDEPPEELTRRLVNELRRGGPPTIRRPGRRIAYWVALAAAACIAGTLVVWQLRRGGDRGPELAKPPAPAPKVPTAEGPTGTPPQPTWWVYHQAARQSPEALESLLDEHADQSALSGPTSWRFGVPVDSQTETL